MPDETRLDGRYQLDDRIAAGGYGEVWRATDLVLGRRVAVKLLLAQHVQQAETLARFRAEAQRAGALNQANIARVYDYVEPNPPQPPFLVMELIDGPSLAQVLTDGPLPPAQVMDIIAGAASGLQAAHDAGLVHRDIKPANLLLARDGTVKVTDFGISYAADSAPMTASGMLVGTAGYMAPERLGAGPVTGAADLYALGIVGYESLAGSPPFTGTPLEIAVAHRDQPLPPLPASVPPGVVALIGALIAKDPAARPASAGDVAQWATSQHDMLVGATRSDLAAPPGMTGPGMAGPGYGRRCRRGGLGLPVPYGGRSDASVAVHPAVRAGAADAPGSVPTPRYLRVRGSLWPARSAAPPPPGPADRRSGGGGGDRGRGHRAGPVPLGRLGCARTGRHQNRGAVRDRGYRYHRAAPHDRRPHRPGPAPDHGPDARAHHRAAAHHHGPDHGPADHDRSHPHYVRRRGRVSHRHHRRRPGRRWRGWRRRRRDRWRRSLTPGMTSGALASGQGRLGY